MFRAADNVSLPGIGFSGGKGSVGIVFSKTPVELIELVVGDIVVDNRVVVVALVVVVVGVEVVDVRWVVIGFTGFAFVRLNVKLTRLIRLRAK